MAHSPPGDKKVLEKPRDLLHSGPPLPLNRASWGLEGNLSDFDPILLHQKLLAYARERYPKPEKSPVAEAAEFSRGEANFYGRPLSALSDHFNGLDPLGAKNYFNVPAYRSAYLLYFFPANWLKLRAALLSARKALPTGKSCSILDLGSGPAPMGLSAVHLLQEDKTAKSDIRLTLIDRSASALDDAHHLSQRLLPVPLSSRDLTVINLPIERAMSALSRQNSRFDLIIAGDTLNELDAGKGAALAETLFKRFLNPNGLLLLIEPALRKTSIALERLRDGILSTLPDIKVLAPCLRQGPCPLNRDRRGRDWCHFYSSWVAPSWFSQLEKAAALNKRLIKYSYVLFQKAAPTAGPSADWRVVSNPLRETNSHTLLLCGPSGKLRLSARNNSMSSKNKDFFTARRGDWVRLKGSGFSTSLQQADLKEYDLTLNPDQHVSVVEALSWDRGELKS